MARPNPAQFPENGPERLFLDRSAEARKYDKQDWPGSSSFHPPHLRDINKILGKQTDLEAVETNGTDELPSTEDE